MNKKRIYGFVGPTASGKTALSLDFAERTGGEILCMDSMQVYRGMDIGTAKPTAEERAQAPHHLLDVADPKESFSVADYQRLAEPFLKELPVPVLVGGTGLYLKALSLPMELGATVGDEAVRRRYEEVAATQGNEALHALLEERDPASAARLHPNDVRRVVRALEVLELTGRPISAQVMPTYEDSPYVFTLFALDWPRDVLYKRINLRVDRMMEEGLEQEVAALRDAGVPENAQSMQGLGYKELLACFRGEMNLPDAVELIKQRTRNYAKRQLTWFRADKRIRWLPADETHFPKIEDIIADMEESPIEPGN